MDDTGWMGVGDKQNQLSTKVYNLYMHGMSNSIHIKSLD